MQLDSDSDQDCLSRDEKRGECVLPNNYHITKWCDASSNFIVLYGIGIALFYMVLHI